MGERLFREQAPAAERLTWALSGALQTAEPPAENKAVTGQLRGLFPSGLGADPWHTEGSHQAPSPNRETVRF